MAPGNCGPIATENHFHIAPDFLLGEMRGNGEAHVGASLAKSFDIRIQNLGQTIVRNNVPVAINRGVKSRGKIIKIGTDFFSSVNLDGNENPQEEQQMAANPDKRANNRSHITAIKQCRWDRGWVNQNGLKMDYLIAAA